MKKNYATFIKNFAHKSQIRHKIAYKTNPQSQASKISFPSLYDIIHEQLPRKYFSLNSTLETIICHTQKLLKTVAHKNQAH